MTAATLTGQDASEAIRLYTTLAARDVRFDAGKVAAAVRSGRARAKLLVSYAIDQTARIVRFVSTPRPRSRTPRRPTVGRRLSRSPGRSSPGRPEPSGDASAAESAARTYGEGR